MRRSSLKRSPQPLTFDPVLAAQRAERRAARRAAAGPRPEDVARENRREAAQTGNQPRATLERKPTATKRRPISPASPEQRAKARTASIVSGETRGLDPAHIAPRSHGGCDDPLCVIALTRAEHRAFDEADPRTGKRLDLLPYLVAHNCHAELAHALMHYRCDLIALLERVTGEKWEPRP